MAEARFRAIYYARFRIDWIFNELESNRCYNASAFPVSIVDTINR